MNEQTFKKGQRVRILDCPDERLHGTTGVIVDTEGTGKLCYLVQPDMPGVGPGYYKEEELEPVEPKFTVGQRVKVAYKDGSGYLATVTEIDTQSNASVTWVYVQDDNGVKAFYTPDELEPVEPPRYVVHAQPLPDASTNVVLLSAGVVGTLAAALMDIAAMCPQKPDSAKAHLDERNYGVALGQYVAAERARAALRFVQLAAEEPAPDDEADTLKFEDGARLDVNATLPFVVAGDEVQP